MFEEEDKSIDPTTLPIFKKGEEIQDIVFKIADLIDDNEDSPLANIKAMMIADSGMLTVKVGGAVAGELYDIKMEAATYIRRAAHDLVSHSHSLEMFGFKYTEYFEIVRKLVEEYRLLFIDWVASFDKWNYIIDRWGLFNPPGVGPFDHDPDEDIPFDGFDEENL